MFLVILVFLGVQMCFKCDCLSHCLDLGMVLGSVLKGLTIVCCHVQSFHVIVLCCNDASPLKWPIPPCDLVVARSSAKLMVIVCGVLGLFSWCFCSAYWVPWSFVSCSLFYWDIPQTIQPRYTRKWHGVFIREVLQASILSKRGKAEVGIGLRGFSFWANEPRGSLKHTWVALNSSLTTCLSLGPTWLKHLENHLPQLAICPKRIPKSPIGKRKIEQNLWSLQLIFFLTHGQMSISTCLSLPNAKPNNSTVLRIFRRRTKSTTNGNVENTLGSKNRVPRPSWALEWQWE